MINISKLLFLSILILGTCLTLSSETWLGMWIGLEMNLIAFIPIIFKSKNISSSESCMMYFLIQSMGSILMLVSVLSNSLITVSPTVIEHFFYSTLMFSMFIKLGVPPFHFWFPEILEKMSWMNCMILMTWQKVAPLAILSLMSEKMLLLPVIIMMSTVVGALGGLNQTSIRKILGYSSISHMGWMIACLKFKNDLWMKYLIIYSAILITMIFVFHMYSSFNINQFNQMSTMTEKTMIIIMFMSLGGLPPFLGFLPKWMVIQSLMTSNSYTLLTIMVLSTLITLFYYLRLVSTMILLSSMSLKWNIKKTNLKNEMQIAIVMINTLLPVISTFSF
uniref:NADH-ubiquinone oxidoreductase chain 2 n=1 Tax=Acanthaspis pedestris TaxID=1387356 RepID=A0A9E8YFH0_9HEMI|nr:NADH dehydrogenase subunit 2 [Acanthaspis pedestris]WAJ48455.1 NADH dehydrogenase subunit 2 [Acanthaspis pedestris]